MIMGDSTLEKYANEAIDLLRALIRTPSFSGEETVTGDLIEQFLTDRGVVTHRKGNNIWAFNRFFDPSRPTILLNSHHDTVKPNPGYTRDPFEPAIESGRLYGLGSNDAGGCLVSLIAVFLYWYQSPHLLYNVCLAATAEEEISGKQGIESILSELGPLDFALVGEPTGMQLAIAEKGLMVLDCVVTGQAGHAARDEGDNAIYRALEDIRWFREYRFPKVSTLTGPVKMSVTMIHAGSQHNVVPATCTYVVDVRVNELYRNEEILDTIREHVQATVEPRSVRLRSSSISVEHPIVQAGIALGLRTYGSPTLSDQALLDIPSLKIGPGDSARSHSADEFIGIDEIHQGIRIYHHLLELVLFQSSSVGG